jgi:hypothetical protein
MDAKQIREKLMNRKPKVELLDLQIPGLPELNGQIAVMEINGEDMTYAKKRGAGEDGVISEDISNAATIARSLISNDVFVNKGTIQRIFSDDDIDFIVKFGSTVLLSLTGRVNRVSGFTEDFLKQLDSSSTTTQSTGSASA